MRSLADSKGIQSPIVSLLGEPMRRDTIEIIAQILYTARQPCIQYVIIQECGLSTEQWNRYRAMLLGAKLLQKEGGNRQKFYRITEKGRKFLMEYEALLSLLQVSQQDA